MEKYNYYFQTFYPYCDGILSGIADTATIIVWAKCLERLGLPNAGKSTLLQAISRARPKIAPYPFTTLKPHLGVVQYSDYEQITVADLPGLIEGSHQNRGLGISFLRHVERCTALILLIDSSGPEPWCDVQLLQHELNCFSPELAQRPKLIVANKIDVEGSQGNLELLKQKFDDEIVIGVSAKFGTNLLALLNKLRSIYDISIQNSSTARTVSQISQGPYHN